MTPAVAPLVLAHAGHWIEGVVYATPVIIIVVLLAVSTWRERRRRGRDERPPSA